MPALQAELARTNANIYVALGREALYAITEKPSIEQWRGSVVPCTVLPGKKALGTYHTAHALRDYPTTYIIEHDLRRAVHESLYSDIRNPKRTFAINLPFRETVDYINSLGSDLSVDIETIGFEVIDCIGIADSATRAICIPFIGGCLTVTELAYVWRKLHAKFLTAGVIGQNIQFDLTRLERYGFKFPLIKFDTMLAHHLLYPEFDHDLGFITSIYTREPYYKHEINTNRWEYNCKDAACTYEAYEGLLEELKYRSQLDYYNEHVLSLIRPIMRMQDEGFTIDQSSLESTRRRLSLEVDYLQLLLERDVGFQINVRSGPDLRRLLHEKLRLPVKKLTAKGAPSTDEEHLRSYIFSHPEHAGPLKAVLDIRERRTLLSGFLDLKLGTDGRYKANYLIHGTKSGRLSSRGRGSADSKKRGPQLQNIPYSARRIFVAAPGCKLAQGDLKRAEAMFVAFDSQSKTLQRLYTDATVNPYCQFASEVMGRPIHKSDDLIYKTFKQVTHASNYGMAWKKLIIVLRLAGINIDDLEIRGLWSGKKKAEFLIESYHARYQEIRGIWHPRIKSQVRATRIIADAFGRKRLFLDRMDEDLFRKAFAQRPQASIVTIANIGIRRLVARGYKVVAQVHDSIVVEYPEDQEAETLRALNDAMTTPITNWGGTFTIPVELKVGYSWGDLKEVHLEDYVSSPSADQSVGLLGGV